MDFMGRPIIGYAELRKEKEVLSKVLESFIKHYNVMGKKLNGMVSNRDIEDVITKTKSEFKLTSHQNDCVEAMFDIFFATLSISGDSRMAKETLLGIFKG